MFDNCHSTQRTFVVCITMCVFKRFNRKTQIWQYEFLLHIFMCFFNLSCAEHNCLIIVTVAETSSLKVLSQALQYGFTFIWMLTCKSTDSEIAESTFHSAVCILMCVFKWLFNKKSHIFNYKFLVCIFMCLFNWSITDEFSQTFCVIKLSWILKVISQVFGDEGIRLYWHCSCSGEGCSGACSLPFRSGVSLVTSVMKGQFCKWDSCYSTVKKRSLREKV